MVWPTFWSTIWLPQLAIAAGVFVAWTVVQRSTGKPVRAVDLIALVLALACLPEIVQYVAAPL